MKKLVIDRRLWYRANGATTSLLLRRDGRMCCLGFYSLACGVPVDDIRGVDEPSSLIDAATGTKLPERMSWLRHQRTDMNSDDSIALQNINDETGDEEKIKELFAKHDEEVVFID